MIKIKINVGEPDLVGNIINVLIVVNGDLFTQ